MTFRRHLVRILLLVLLALFGCSQERVVDVIQERNDGLFYVGNEEKPFTGQGSAYWDAEKTKKKAIVQVLPETAWGPAAWRLHAQVKKTLSYPSYKILSRRVADV